MAVKILDSDTPLTIETIRDVASKFYVYVMIAMVIVNIAVAAVFGRSIAISATLSLIAAGATIVSMRVYGQALPARIATASAFAIQMMTLIYSTSGSSPVYTQEAHMMYFIINSFLVFFLCWRSIAVYNAIIVVHHVALTFVFPSIIWSDVSFMEGFGHLVIHALIVVMATPPLLLAAVKFEQSLNLSASAMAESKAAAEDALRMADEARKMATEAEDSRTAAIDVQKNTDAMKKKIAEGQQLVVTHLALGLKAMSQGDLTARIDADFPEEFQQLRQDFNASIDQLANAIHAISSISSSIATSSNEVKIAADDLAQRSHKQASAVEESVTALEGISTAVSNTHKSASDASQLVATTNARAERSQEVVNSAVIAMQEIESSSHEINNILALIDDIAFQTNLLALNASVEAARAGDAGNGFAVVAQEVRQLAKRSADAAKDIKVLIVRSSEQVSNGVSLVNEAGSALGEIVAQVREINTNVGRIVDAAGEQSTKIQNSKLLMKQIDEGTRQNASIAEESTAAGNMLFSEAARLNEQLQTFSVKKAPQRTYGRSPVAA